MSNKIRKEQIDNGENILFRGDGAIDVGSDNLITQGNIEAEVITVADEAYGEDWNGSLEVPTKNAVYDKVETLINEGAVVSVNEQTGEVELDTDDIPEGTAKYFSDELAQDAVGAMVDSTLVYNDSTPALGRAGITGDVNISAGSNTSAIASGVIVNADINASAGIDASKIANGTVSSTEFQYINSLSSNAQDQLNAKVGLTGNETVAGVKTFSSIPILPGSDPTSANEAARKAYVDAIANGIDPSLKVGFCDLAVDVDNITQSGEQTIDGVLTSSSRVVDWRQVSDPSKNGIWITGAGAWTRATDYDQAAEIKNGTSTFVLDGTQWARTIFFMTSPDVATVGTDPITFTPAGGSASYEAGTGIDITGNTISVDTDYISDNGIVTHTGTSIVGRLPVFDSTDNTLENSGLIITEDSDSSEISVNSITKILLDKTNNQLTLNAGNSYQRIGDGFTRVVDIFDSQSYAYYDTLSPFYDDGEPYAVKDEVLILPEFKYYKFFGQDFGNLYFEGSNFTEAIFGAKYTFIANTDSTSEDFFGVNLDTDLLTDNRDIQYPDQSGTIALTSDISPSTDVQVFTSNGTWTKPAGAKSVLVQLIGGGGGGGSGRKGATGTIRCGGGGGGGGGMATMTFDASVLGSTESVVVGQGGNGGAPRTANSTNGISGAIGGSTVFGALLRAGGGTQGIAGTLNSGSAGAGGSIFTHGNILTSLGNGGFGSTFGGAGGSSLSTPQSPTGGGAGGGVTSANVANIGGFSGNVGVGDSNDRFSGLAQTLSGASGGAINTNANNGGSLDEVSFFGGTGGGGGGGSTTTNGGAGGNGGSYGAGGGGGGGATNSVGNSGAGGNGAPGICIVTTFY
jgi:hypothetical protein